MHRPVLFADGPAVGFFRVNSRMLAFCGGLQREGKLLFRQVSDEMGRKMTSFYGVT